MAERIEVRIPRDNVNDESAILVKWHVANTAAVEQDQILAEIETSKTVVEVTSPAKGYVHFSLPAGIEVPIGALLCVISDSPAGTSAAAAAASEAAPKVQLHESAPDFVVGSPSLTSPLSMASSSVRLSVAAQRLASDCGIDVNVFAGRGLIRESDVRSFVDGSHADSHTTTAPALEENGSEHRSHLVTGVPAHAQPLSRRKRQEIKALWSGTHHALPSAVSIACATRGLRQAAATQASLHGNATALIIFEVARLLRKFPVFNACFHENQIVFYDDVNIGFAVDAGNGLKVPVVHQADKKSLTAVAGHVQEAIFAYMEDRLPVSALGRGTFTVTDLSGEEVFDFLPLINEGQSAILGVGGEQYVGAASVGTYQLILAFDHRLSDGRTAGSFLRCLRDRLAAHENALIGGGPTMDRIATAADVRLPLSCGRCGRTAADVEQLQGYLLASVMPFGPVCSVCVRGY